MGNRRGRAGSTWARVCAVGALWAALAAVVPGVATAASAGSADRVGTIMCDRLEVDGTSVLGHNCDTDHWGPLENFILSGRGGRVFHCQSGWAEGSLWVRGENCKRIQ
ncbi:MAG: hypothetical protein HOV94_36465 [Saccharothrix sp.]|nr:hypothetical protein [Saccharothrix sp.]